MIVIDSVIAEIVQKVSSRYFKFKNFRRRLVDIRS